MSILEKINSPEDLKNVDNFYKLATEIRYKIIEITHQNGGHLASNLGVVEFTIALLKVYGSKDDVIVWDVGHQCYAYKMLTGRYKDINSIRIKDGLSGFINKEESNFDYFTSGHASTAISVSLGISTSGKFKGKKIAVVGDGAMTGGLAYEGLSNVSKFGKDLLVILNDNEMSISKNVGFIAKYLVRLRTVPTYISTKEEIGDFLNKIPFFGINFKKILRNSKQIIKTSLIKSGTIFEDMGFVYYGPIDGHDINALIKIFTAVKNIHRPVIIHMITKKGKGYSMAEKQPCVFHGVNKHSLFCKDNVDNYSFSEIFGTHLCKLASKNLKIYAVTAAMTSALGLCEYASKYNNRFADVGIAEPHAAVFCAGLAIGGMIPFFCVYSTFLQRITDNIIHDILMQKLKVIFAIDRAGFIGTDGESHQGIFDIAILSVVPNIKIYAPSFYVELEFMMDLALKDLGCSAIRYPKGNQFYKPKWQKYENEDFEIYKNSNNLPMKLIHFGNFLISEEEILIITYGRIFSNAAKILEEFKNKIILVKLNVITSVINSPDKDFLKFLLKFKKIMFFEEHVKSGSIGEKLAYILISLKYNGDFLLKSINECFVKHSEVEEQLKMFSLDFEGMKKEILKELKQNQ